MAVTRQEVLQTFAEVQFVSVTVFEQFLDMVFGVPGAGSPFLPLAGGTMSGNIDLDDVSSLVNARGFSLSGGRFITSQDITKILIDFGSVGSERFLARFIDTTNSTIFFDQNNVFMENLGTVGGFMGVLDNPSVVARRMVVLAAKGEIIHNVDIDVIAGADLNLNGLNIGFFGGTARPQPAAFTAVDATDLTVELTAAGLVNTLAVINSLRVTLNEAVAGLNSATGLGLFA